MLKSLNYYVKLQGKYLRPNSWRVLTLAALFSAGIGLTLVAPQVIRHFIDTAQEQGALSRLYTAGVLFLVISLAGRVMQTLTSYVSQDLAWRATNRLRSDLLLHLLKLPMSFHNAHTPGELIERVDGDVANLGNFFSKFALSLLRSVFLLTGVLVLLSLEDWRIGLSKLDSLVKTRFEEVPAL